MKTELIPNCLLTRYPVCFLHGQKNLFNFFRYWNGIPQYLRDHGYEVFELNTLWRGNSKTRAPYFEEQFKWLTTKYDGLHLIIEGQAVEDIHFLTHNSDSPIKEKLKSITLLKPGVNKGSRENIRLDLGPIPKIFTAELSKKHGSARSLREKFLKHCIFLAEWDVQTAK